MPFSGIGVLSAVGDVGALLVSSGDVGVLT